MISNTVDTLLSLLLLPGTAAVDWLARHAPAAAKLLALGETGGTITIIVSVLAWLALLILLGVVLESIGKLDRTLTAWVSGFFGEIRRQLRILRRRIVSTIGQYRQRRQAKSLAIDVAEITLERIETAVLRCHAGVGEIRVMAMADVAGVLRVPQSQVSKALVRLREYHLVERAFGTDEGREGHHITRAGQIYLIEH
jgi:DNA-binding MarR family transcriptional regulator